MKICRLFPIPLLGAVLIIASCKTEEPKQGSAAPPSNAIAPTLSNPASPGKHHSPTPKIQETLKPKTDPVVDIIQSAESEYAKGQANYAAGHLEAAKDNFNRAFDLLVTGSVAIHSDERLENEFDKIVEGVNRLELVALKEGDGFTEQRSEPAPIDEANEVTFPVDPAVRARAEAELRQTHSDLPLVMNDQVASFINYFSAGKGRGVLERALVRSGRYREMISRIFKEEGVPQDLIYLAEAESGFHPLALSNAGARGMWQFMAGRASGYGLERNWWVDERQDPEKSTRAAARHLRDLYNQFGDWYLAMAAYNSGPGTVQRAVERTGYADFWELYRRNALPAETRNYVPIILAVTIVAKNPAVYGLDNIVPETPPAVDTVKIRYAVDLRLAAECIDASVTRLQELNPSLLRMTTPKDELFELKLPAGTAAKFQAAITSIPLEMRTQWRYHKVQFGETLSQVAQRYHTSTRSIAEVNNIQEDAVLQKDTKLIIPVTPVHRVTRDVETVSFSRHPVIHTVRRGETALSVADDYDVPVERLRKWNHLRGNQLRVGHALRIYKPVTNAHNGEEPSAESDRSRHGNSEARLDREQRETASSRSSRDRHEKRGRYEKNDARSQREEREQVSSRSQRHQKAVPVAASQRNGKRRSKSDESEEPRRLAAKGKGAKSRQAEASNTKQQRVHKVRHGETLASIASEYNTTVAALKRDNRKVASNLRPGQVLIIK